MAKTEGISIDNINYYEKYLPLPLFLIALLMRLYMVFAADVITADGISYISAAKLIGSGELGEIPLPHIGLYPFLIFLSHKIVHDWELAGRLLSAVFGSLTVVPLCLLFKKMFDAKVALVTSMFFIINPCINEYSGDVLRDPCLWFFSIASLWLAWEGMEPKRWSILILSALSVCLAAFTRIEGVALFAIIISWLIWRLAVRELSMRRFVICLAVFILALPICLSPFLFYFKSKLGSWEFGHVGAKLHGLAITDTEEVIRLNPETVRGTSVQFRAFYDLSKRQRYASITSEIVLKFVKSLSPVLAVLLFFGIFFRRIFPVQRREVPLLIWLSGFFASSFFYMTKTYYLSTRHSILLVLPALAWAGIGYFELYDKLKMMLQRSKGSVSKASPYVHLILVFLIMALVLPKTLELHRKDKVELKKAGHYLKETGYSGEKFIGDPALIRAAFYGDLDFQGFSAGMDYEGLISFIKDNNVKYLLINERKIDEAMHDLRNKLDPAIFERVPINEFESYKEYSFVVYRIIR